MMMMMMMTRGVFSSCLFFMAALLAQEASSQEDEVIMKGHTRPQMYTNPLPFTYMDPQRLPQRFSWHNVQGRSYLSAMRKYVLFGIQSLSMSYLELSVF